MGIKSIVKKAAGKAGNAVAKLSALSPEQLEEVEGKRTAYLAEMPSGNDPMAVELTSRLIAAGWHRDIQRVSAANLQGVCSS